MFKKYLILLLLIVIGNSFNTSFAATDLHLPQSYPVLYVDFQQERSIEGLKKPIVSDGKMIISMTDGLFWQQLMPFEMTMLITPQKMVNQIGNGRKEIITAKDNPALFQFNHLLSSLFTMDTNSIAKYFKIASVTPHLNGNTIILEPITAPVDKIFKTITLTINNNNISSVELIDLQGDSTTLTFKNHEGYSSLKGQDVQIFQ